MVVWNSMLLKNITKPQGVVKQHVRFIKLNFKAPPNPHPIGRGLGRG
jgi:hypothetical protein